MIASDRGGRDQYADHAPEGAAGAEQAERDNRGMHIDRGAMIGGGAAPLI